MQLALRGIPKLAPEHFDVGGIATLCEQPCSFQRELVRSDEQLLRGLSAVLEAQLIELLEARNVLEFKKLREDAWPKYIRARRAFADTLNYILPESTIGAIAKESASALAEDIQKQRGVRFGDALTDQVVFTIWTFGKINELAQAVNGAGEPSDKETDRKLHSEYNICSLWGLLHLDLVATVMKFRRNIPSDVQEAVCDGLRIALNVYAILKEAMALRHPQHEAPLTVTLPWDAEDERLLALSMKDLNADFSDGH